VITQFWQEVGVSLYFPMGQTQVLLLDLMKGELQVSQLTLSLQVRQLLMQAKQLEPSQ
jgi:hypothetical protein